MYQYAQRIVIFIDILDYKGIIAGTVNQDGSDNSDGLRKVERIHEIIQHFLTPDEDEKLDADIQITQFSDCVALSFDYTSESQIFNRLLTLQWMLINLTRNGVLCRGGIAIGKVLHTKDVLFGPALVEAYLLESKAALYPRIVVSEAIVNLAGKYRRSGHTPEDEIEYVKNILKKDTDGLYYVDYFASVQSELDDPEYDFHEYLLALYDIVSTGIKSSDPGVRVKYMWMKEKYNPIISAYKRCRKKGSCKFLDPQLRDAYLSLPKIV